MSTGDIKTVFASALTQLLRAKPINTISVREITELCDLSSRTFYNYFEDKYDLMNYLYYAANEKCWFLHGKPCSMAECYSRCAEMRTIPAQVWRNMYSYVGQNDLRDFVLKKTRSDFRRLFIWNGYEELLDTKDTKSIIDFFSFSIVTIFENYLCYNTGTNYPNSQLFFSMIPEPQRSAMIADPKSSGKLEEIDIFSPRKHQWPPVFY